MGHHAENPAAPTTSHQHSNHLHGTANSRPLPTAKEAQQITARHKQELDGAHLRVLSSVTTKICDAARLGHEKVTVAPLPELIIRQLLDAGYAVQHAASTTTITWSPEAPTRQDPEPEPEPETADARPARAAVESRPQPSRSLPAATHAREISLRHTPDSTLRTIAAIATEVHAQARLGHRCTSVGGRVTQPVRRILEDQGYRVEDQATTFGTNYPSTLITW